MIFRHPIGWLWYEGKGGSMCLKSTNLWEIWFFPFKLSLLSKYCLSDSSPPQGRIWLYVGVKRCWSGRKRAQIYALRFFCWPQDSVTVRPREMKREMLEPSSTKNIILSWLTFSNAPRWMTPNKKGRVMAASMLHQGQCQLAGQCPAEGTTVPRELSRESGPGK